MPRPQLSARSARWREPWPLLPSVAALRSVPRAACNSIILVPGGNATLLLSALPSLARHGALAYLSMLGVQVSLAMVAKQWKQHNLRAAAAAQRSSAKTLP